MFTGLSQRKSSLARSVSGRVPSTFIQPFRLPAPPSKLKNSGHFESLSKFVLAVTRAPSASTPTSLTSPLLLTQTKPTPSPCGYNDTSIPFVCGCAGIAHEYRDATAVVSGVLPSNPWRFASTLESTTDPSLVWRLNSPEIRRSPAGLRSRRSDNTYPARGTRERRTSLSNPSPNRASPSASNIPLNTQRPPPTRTTPENSPLELTRIATAPSLSCRESPPTSARINPLKDPTIEGTKGSSTKFALIASPGAIVNLSLVPSRSASLSTN